MTTDTTEETATRRADPVPGDGATSGTPGAARQASLRPRGRLLAGLAFLLAVLALGAVAYVGYFLRFAPDALEGRVDAFTERLDDLDRRVASGPDSTTIRTEVERSVAALRQTLETEIDTQLALGLAGMTGPVAPPAPASEVATPLSVGTVVAEAAPPVAVQPEALPPAAPRDWQFAEIRYLLRMANHRLQLEGDSAGAAVLLRSADAALAVLDDPALLETRAQLAAEILALESVQAIDVEGVFLQLEAIKRELDSLPLRLPTFAAGDASPDAADGDSALTDAPWWQVVLGRLEQLVRFRRFDGAVQPLLAPEEAVYLELNLRLMLERAQLAALRREQVIYDQSVGVAIDWIERYLDDTSLPVARVLSGLRGLQGRPLARSLPDISGSLRAFDAGTTGWNRLAAPVSESGR